MQHATTTLGVRLSTEVVEELEALAEHMGRSKSYLAAEAIRVYLNENAWQVEAIIHARNKADEGRDFVGYDEVEAWVRSWGKGSGRERDGKKRT